jgi:glyoxylase I family protein
VSITGLSHINLRANRELLDRLRDFYVDVVGLHIGERPPFKSSGYWLYSGERPIVHLVEARPGEHSVIAAGAILDHVAFAVSQLDDAEMRLRQHAIEYERRQVPLTGQRQLFFNDPAGNGVELVFDEREKCLRDD